MKRGKNQAESGSEKRNRLRAFQLHENGLNCSHKDLDWSNTQLVCSMAFRLAFDDSNKRSFFAYRRDWLHEHYTIFLV